MLRSVASVTRLSTKRPLRRFSTFNTIEFAGGGIFFWWYAGAAIYLAEQSYLKDVPLIGTSAGAVAASMLALDSPFHTAPEVAVRIGKAYGVDKSRTGLVGVFGRIAKEFLEELTPPNPEETQLRRLNIVVTPRRVHQGPEVLTGFYTKEDVINAVMASIHIPLIMNGELFAEYQQQKYIDGSFWTLIRSAGFAWRMRNLEVGMERPGTLLLDYKHDSAFMQTFGKMSIMKLVRPDDLHVMMDFGYDYVRRLDQQLDLRKHVQREQRS